MRKIIYCLALFLTTCTTKEPASDTQSATSDTHSGIPKGMVLIPAGTFVMGGKSEQAEADELPRHEVELSAFYMDETEVTNAAFLLFVEATGYQTVAERDIDWDELSKQVPPGTPKPADSLLKAGSLVFQATSGPVDMRDYSQWWRWTIGANWRHPEGPDSNIDNKMSYPVVHIAWEDAMTYARWAGKRLPTEAEWEWAAQGGLKDTKYPWGNESPELAYNKANFWQGLFPFQNQEQDGFYAASPVQSFPPNGYGLYDMAGNVWEWCRDYYRNDAYFMDHQKGTVSNPNGPSESFDPTEPLTIKYSMRGGSFLCNDSYCSGYRVSRRMKSTGDSGFNHTGFRCVKSL
ncbi:MAG: formylglycine-generating enzyme family protein [Reichenbachiella sp.]|uniref:formylglycine-generating enzyme family protein n=1 Tax=Reichenbachiella sp. TaxID=2184521 RepID=UPI003266155A